MADVICSMEEQVLFLKPFQKKLVACLDYLDCNRNIYEYFNACHNLRCRDDFIIF